MKARLSYAPHPHGEAIDSQGRAGMLALEFLGGASSFYCSYREMVILSLD